MRVGLRRMLSIIEQGDGAKPGAESRDMRPKRRSRLTTWFSHASKPKRVFFRVAAVLLILGSLLALETVFRLMLGLAPRTSAEWDSIRDVAIGIAAAVATVELMYPRKR